jgi:hypothetical protein
MSYDYEKDCMGISFFFIQWIICVQSYVKPHKQTLGKAKKLDAEGKSLNLGSEFSRKILPLVTKNDISGLWVGENPRLRRYREGRTFYIVQKNTPSL